MAKIRNKALILTLANCVLLTSCASYKASSLDQLSAVITQDKNSTNDISIAIKSFDQQDCHKYLDRNVIKQGFQPIQIRIENNSDKNYIFSTSRLNPTPAKVEEVAKTVHTSTGMRVAAYGAGSLILFPLIIPAIVDGIKSAEANTQLDNDFIAKSAKDTIIHSYSSIDTLLFIPKTRLQEKLSITLIEQKTNEPVNFQLSLANN